uniref:thermospermine synthase ACAULIS5-like n=1 Tax=Fragaria vesca subsp. vesca TaxID=101020 RepID=UPI0005CAF498|nr:PREDICTED: thermospermine synthase ACAULIS5-like [Fragaria vesca subsp. vesca]
MSRGIARGRLAEQNHPHVLVIDGKMQSAEVDEFMYRECLIHRALLSHPKPKNVFIMGGGEVSAAREALKHKLLEKVVMCDITRRPLLTISLTLFSMMPRKFKALFCLLNKSREEFDIIVGHLAEPVEGGPCYQLYTKSFYEKVLKPKLNHGGIFVTQAGPAGIFTHIEVFTSIFNTIKQVFKSSENGQFPLSLRVCEGHPNKLRNQICDAVLEFLCSMIYNV